MIHGQLKTPHYQICTLDALGGIQFQALDLDLWRLWFGQPCERIEGTQPAKAPVVELFPLFNTICLESDQQGSPSEPRTKSGSISIALQRQEAPRTP